MDDVKALREAACTQDCDVPTPSAVMVQVRQRACSAGWEDGERVPDAKLRPSGATALGGVYLYQIEINYKV